MIRHRTLFVYLLAAPLFLSGLGSTYLWTDEAQTALLGVSVLNTGLPLTGVGADSVSAACGRDAGSGGMHLQIAWLQSYVAAASIGLLGQNSIAARLPFAMLGFACVPMAAWLVGLAGGRSRERLLAALLTGSSVYFILHARQARYYALAAFFTLAVAGAYWLFMQRRPRSAAWLALSSTALVLSFEVTALGVLAAIAAHGLWSARRDSAPGAEIRRLATALVLPCLTLLGWLGLAASAPTRSALSSGSGLLLKPIYYAVQFNAHVAPLLIVVPLIIAIAARRSLANPRLRLLGVIGCLTLGGTMAAFAPPLAFPRYTIGLVPLMLCGVALLIGEFADRFAYPAAVTAALGLLLISGLPHKVSNDLVRAGGFALGLDGRLKFHPAESWRPELLDLLNELGDPPRGPLAAVITHLGGYADPGDAIVTMYGVPPLRFHSGLAAYGGLTCQLPTGDSPEWIWTREKWQDHHLSSRVLEWVEESIDLSRYETVMLDVPDRRFENRADIHEHVFGNPGPAAPPVRLLHRMPKSDARRQ